MGAKRHQASLNAWFEYDDVFFQLFWLITMRCGLLCKYEMNEQEKKIAHRLWRRQLFLFLPVTVDCRRFTETKSLKSKVKRDINGIAIAG